MCLNQTNTYGLYIMRSNSNSRQADTISTDDNRYHLFGFMLTFEKAYPMYIEWLKLLLYQKQFALILFTGWIKMLIFNEVKYIKKQI